MDGSCVTPEETAFFVDIAAHIRQHPDQFELAGEWLDKSYFDKRGFKKNTGITTRRRRFTLHERLSAAFHEFLRRSEAGHYLSLLDARVVCLITWLLTDPDAENANLGLTAFEKWPWGEHDPDATSLGRYLTYHFFDAHRQISSHQLLHHFSEGDSYRCWLPLAKRAWSKVRSAKGPNRKKMKNKKKKKTAKNSGGRPRLKAAEAKTREEFFLEVKTRKRENGTPMKTVASEWGITEKEGKAYLQWYCDQVKRTSCKKAPRT